MVGAVLDETALQTHEHLVVSPPAAVETETRQPGADRLRVLALGPLQVFVGDRLVATAAWGSARPRELLVYLLLHPEGRTKEQVGLAFWPDASPAQLRNNFHVMLHRLRRALGHPEWIVVAGERYAVDPAVVAEFDAAAFERELADARRALRRQQEGATAQLEAALERVRGDLLDGEPAGDWHLEHRDRLQRLCVDALMALGEQLVREGQPARAAEAYRRVLARDELHEEALQALMRCQAASGERTQALRAYQRFATRLREELESEPGAATVRLFERLRQDVGA
jgi:DNA-binding SARP family transcriptional activator